MFKTIMAGVAFMTSCAANDSIPAQNRIVLVTEEELAKQGFLGEQTGMYKIMSQTIARETAEADFFVIPGGEQFQVQAVEFENDEWMWRIQDFNCDKKRVIQANPGGKDKGFGGEHDEGVPTGKNLFTYTWNTTAGPDYKCSITIVLSQPFARYGKGDTSHDNLANIDIHLTDPNAPKVKPITVHKQAIMGQLKVLSIIVLVLIVASIAQCVQESNAKNQKKAEKEALLNPIKEKKQASESSD